MKTIAIHQPEYLPIMGYVHKAKHADVFVVLDDVQFNRDSLQQRAKVSCRAGETAWMTIPFVHKFPQQINTVEVADSHWQHKHSVMLRGYSRAPHFASAWSVLEPLFKVFHEKLAETTIASVDIVFALLDVKTKIVRSSLLGAEGKKGDRVLDICRKLDATHYLSGRSGASYLDRAAFADAGIEIVVQDFSLPVYREGQPEVAGLSAVDALFHLGDKAKEIIS